MFFSRFPKKAYNFDLVANSTVVITDILSRVRFNSRVVDSVSAYYKYQLQDGDTPEIVAAKEYGDPEYHWVVILVNNIKDPQFDFPLNIDALEHTIVKKYGYTGPTHGERIAQAYSNTHHYILQSTKTLIEVGGLKTVNVTNSVVTLEQYSYKTNTLSTFAPNIPIVYPQNTANTIYFKANNSGQNTASSANATASLQISEVYRAVSVYDHEIEENEKKRTIKLLKPEYIQPLSTELNVMLVGRR